MTRIYDPEDGIWTIGQSSDTASSDNGTTKVSLTFGLNDRISSSIPEVPAAPSPLGRLGVFAIEIRLMVYRHLLVSKTLIYKPNLLIGPRRHIMAWENVYNEEIDGAILRMYSRSL